MRILQIAGSFAPDRIGGPAVLAERVSVGLRDRGHEVVVLTAADGPAVRYEVRGLPVVAVPPDSVAGMVPDLLRIVRPDVVHAHSPRSLGALPLHLAQQSGLPTVLSRYGAEPAVPADLVARADAVVLDAPVPNSPGNTRLVPTGALPPPPGWHRPPRRGPVRIGFLGGLDPDQGLALLLQALAELGRSDYELHVVDRAALSGVRAIREQDVRAPGLVRLVPGFDPWRGYGFYGGIDVLVSLPQSEGHVSLALRDAMAHGVWPIATRVAANAEVIAGGADGRTCGDLVPTGASAELGAALARAMDAPPAGAGPAGAGPTEAGPTPAGPAGAVPTPAGPAGAVPLLADQVAALEVVYREVASR